MNLTKQETINALLRLRKHFSTPSGGGNSSPRTIARLKDISEVLAFVKSMPVEMPDPAKYERSMNGLRKLICEPKMDGSGTLRGDGWDAASRKAWFFFERHLKGGSHGS